MHNRALLSAIRVIHQESRATYGSPSIWDALIKQGHAVGEHRIARLMRVEGIRAKTVKKRRATTDSDHTWLGGHQYPEPTVPGQAAQPGVGRGHHLRLDDGGLTLPRGGARPLLARRD